ncbi:uncharacterized protein LOC130732207 [Lotus japonicus]|uniref:uncharacterized protein LOC130732207 n=1 Tax=Lotus japonicus TaxID=34305 RepID=UPI0025874C2F|nr:uncharacterized protein LOC130732207 [Lotus japonicus]
MYALRLRSPHSNPRIFVRPLNPLMTYVIVPRRFHDSVGHEINDVVQIRDPIGNTFNFSYYYNLGDFRLGAGFTALRAIHHIEITVFIHFIYRRYSTFCIHIYDPVGREVSYNIAPELGPPLNPNVVGVQDNNAIDLSSDDESDDELDQAPWMEKIWEANITDAHILGHQTMTISSRVQQTFFPNLPPVITVILPDGNNAQWHITWRVACNSIEGSSGSRGRVGYLAAGWCDFYRSEFRRLRNSGQVHRIELWELSDSDSYMVQVFTM